MCGASGGQKLEANRGRWALCELMFAVHIYALLQTHLICSVITPMNAVSLDYFQGEKQEHCGDMNIKLEKNPETGSESLHVTELHHNIILSCLFSDSLRALQWLFALILQCSRGVEIAWLTSNQKISGLIFNVFSLNWYIDNFIIWNQPPSLEHFTPLWVLLEPFDLQCPNGTSSKPTQVLSS